MSTAGSMVKGGFYFNRDKWDIVTVSGKEGLLPGDEGQQFLPIPFLAVLLLAPLAGCLCVVLSPLLGILWLFQRLGRFVVSSLKSPPLWLLSIVEPFKRRGGSKQATGPAPPPQTTEAAPPQDD